MPLPANRIALTVCDPVSPKPCVPRRTVSLRGGTAMRDPQPSTDA